MVTKLLTNSLFITLFPTGIIIWAIGLYVLKFPPVKINKIYGYRTKRSMQSQEAWNYAQTYSTKLMVDAAKTITLLGLLSVFININPEAGALIGTMIILAALAYPFIRTEKELKDKFNNKI